MLHVTCAAHAVHRVAEECRQLFPDVDKLISNGKRIFPKAPSRVTMFKDTVPGTPLPPEHIITRWGTLISAAMYYAENLDPFATVVDALDEDDAACIVVAQDLLAKDSLKAELVFIAAHFGAIPSTIENH